LAFDVPLEKRLVQFSTTKSTKTKDVIKQLQTQSNLKPQSVKIDNAPFSDPEADISQSSASSL
jgi:uncharacterized protein involved in type VI secretion and phage assembly